MGEKSADRPESFVCDELRHTVRERKPLVSRQEPAECLTEIDYTPVIKIVGVGGAGNNTIHRIYDIDRYCIEIIGIDTDKQHLDYIHADKKILIGKSLTGGLGAGSNYETGRKAAERGKSTLKEVLGGAEIVFLTAGLGGGTGSGASPVVAEIAREQGAIVVSLVGTPSQVEQVHGIKAEPGLSDLRKVSNTFITLDNNRLLELVPNLPMHQIFSVMDTLISGTIMNLSMNLTKHPMGNTYLADFHYAFREGGDSALLVGECIGPGRSRKIAEAILSNPLNDLDYHRATGALINITGGPEMTRENAQYMAEAMARELGPDIRTQWRARCEKDFKGRVRAFVIMTGIK